MIMYLHVKCIYVLVFLKRNTIYHRPILDIVTLKVQTITKADDILEKKKHYLPQTNIRYCTLTAQTITKADDILEKK